MSEWQQYDDGNGTTYYYNTVTQETSWEVPATLHASSDDWQMVSDDSGQIYYYNATTNASSWEKPAAYQSPVDSLSAPPSDFTEGSSWVEQSDGNGSIYYFNTKTQVTQWERPSCLNFGAASAAVNNLETDDISRSWLEKIDDQGSVYYYNTKTEVTQWERPGCLDPATTTLTSSTETKITVGEILKATKEKEKRSEKLADAQPKQRKSVGQLKAVPGSIEQAPPKTPRGSMNEALSKTPRGSIAEATSKTPRGSIAEATSKTPRGSITEATSKPPRGSNAESTSKTPRQSINDFGAPSMKSTDEGTTSVSASNGASATITSIHTSQPFKGTTIATTGPEKEKGTRSGGDDKDEHEEAPKERERGASDAKTAPDPSPVDEVPPAVLTGQQSSSKLPLELLSLAADAPLAEIVKRLAPYSLEQFGDAHFNLERRGNGLFQNKLTSERILAWRPEPMKAPLCPLSPELTLEALECSRSITGFMGDRRTKKTPVEHATCLLQRLLSAPSELADEAYLQICKQTRSNPSFESTERGWQLLLLCLATFPPSDELWPHMGGYFSSCVGPSLSASGAQAVGPSGAVSSPPSSLVGQGGGGGTMSMTAPSAIGKQISTVGSGGGQGQGQGQGQGAHGQSTQGVIARLAEIALRSSIKAIAAPPRLELPTPMEVEALRMGEAVVVRVHFLDNKFTMVRADSWTTVRAIKRQVALKIGLSPSSEQCFGVYQQIVTPSLLSFDADDERHGQGETEFLCLDGDRRVLDVVAMWQRWQVEERARGLRSVDISAFRFVFKIKYFIEPNSHIEATEGTNGDSLKGIAPNLPGAERSPSEIAAAGGGAGGGLQALGDMDPPLLEMFYIQAVHDVVAGHYPCSENDFFVLAALQLQEVFGDMPSTVVDALTQSNPWAEPQVLQRMCEQCLRSAGVGQFLPPDLTDEEQKRRHADARLLQLYIRLLGYSQHEARVAYLGIVRSWKCYGANYFFAEAQSNRDYPFEILLAVTCTAVLVINPGTRCFLAEYPYSTILTWGHSYNSFVLVTGGLLKQTKNYFKTEHGKEINDIVQVHMNGVPKEKLEIAL